MPNRMLIPALLLAVSPWPLAALGQERFTLADGQWQQQTTFDPATPEGQLQTIRKALAEEQAGEALELADAWIEQYPNHPMLVEAYLLRGDARVADHGYYKALFDYEFLIRRYPASEQFMTALEREFEIARLFSAGMRRRLWGMRVLPADDEAEELYIRIQERAPGSDLGERASLALADHYFDRAAMSSAVEAYDLFLLNYPRSRHREKAMLRLIQASLATFKGPRFDSTGLLEAGQRLKGFQKEFPAAAERMGADALNVRIEESLALKMLYNAQWYDVQNKRVSAATMYQRVVHDHPRTASARAAMQRLAEMGIEVQEPTAAATTNTTAAPPATTPGGDKSTVPIEVKP